MRRSVRMPIKYAKSLTGPTPLVAFILPIGQKHLQVVTAWESVEMPAPGENLKINGQRLWDSLMEMAEIGPGVAGGNNRQTVTDEDSAGRHLFQSWCDAAGCTMGLDTMGNMFARREGTDPNALPVYVGSHLDTQPTGGRYDGVLGVLGGLEIIRTMNDLDIKTKHPIVVTNRKMHAFFELHIEQGPILEAEGKDIGVVTHGQGLRWIECTVTGKESHTGSTPMHMRKNAGRGLARVTELVHEIAMKNQPNAVGAIGHIDVYPNSRNIIPGKVVFTVDMRTHLIDKLHAMVAEFMEKAPQLCEEIDVGFSCECVDGLSHNEAEEISPAWAAAGTDVLFHAVVETAEIVS